MPDNVYRIAKKKDIQDVETYLRNAKSKDFAPTGWARGNNWLYGHGEGSSTSKETYHIGFKMQSDGHHVTCLFIQMRGTQRKLVVEGRVTEKDWGDEAPSPKAVLMFYKKEWGVEDSGDEDDED